jgi:phage gp36-like protein
MKKKTMNFLSSAELKSVIYDYQLNEIVENDSTIIEMAIQAATEEVKSYLCSRYDTTQTFNETKNNRNPLILEFTKDIALWQIIRLSNPEIIHEKVKDRYDRAIEYLNKVAKGLISPTLPLLQDNSGSEILPVRFGSMVKQSYDY